MYNLERLSVKGALKANQILSFIQLSYTYETALALYNNDNLFRNSACTAFSSAFSFDNNNNFLEIILPFI